MTGQITIADKAWQALRVLGWLGVAAIMIAPVTAMRFTTEVNWTASDFVFAAVVLVGGGVLVEVFALRVRSSLLRIGFGVVVVAAAAVIWGMAI